MIWLIILIVLYAVASAVIATLMALEVFDVLGPWIGVICWVYVFLIWPLGFLMSGVAELFDWYSARFR